MSALERWQKTKLVIEIGLARAMTLEEAQEFLGGISGYLDLARSVIAELEAENERLRELMREARDDFHGRAVLFSSRYLDAIRKTT